MITIKKDGRKIRLNIFGIKIHIPYKRKIDYPIDKELIDRVKENIKVSTVLILEVNDFHGEIMPGYIKYFIDLGYNVDFFTTDKHLTDLPLCRFKSEKLQTYYTNISTIEKILQNQLIMDNYKGLFINTVGIFRNDRNVKLPASFEKYFDKIHIPQNIFCIGVSHDVEHSSIEASIIKDYVVLGNTKKGLPIVNPCYFGDINITPKNDKTIFLVSGDLRRDYSIIESAVQQLIEHNVTDFEVYITGRKNYTVKNNLTKYINFAGYLDFEHLYSLVERADFILPCLEPNKKKHEKYIYDTTSGCFQLSYGFCKPVVIAEKFAQKALVDNNSAILYDQNEDMYKAMTNAINMTKEEYNSMQNNIKKITKALYEQSKENLNKLITKESKELCLK